MLYYYECRNIFCLITFPQWVWKLDSNSAFYAALKSVMDNEAERKKISRKQINKCRVKNEITEGMEKQYYSEMDENVIWNE